MTSSPQTETSATPEPTGNGVAGPARVFDIWFSRLCLVLGGIPLLLMTVLCVVNVIIMRKLLNDPIVGAEDVLILSLVAFVAISIPFGGRSGAHIEIEVVTEMLPKKAGLYMKLFARICGAAFLALMSWQLGHAGTQAARFGEVSLQLSISYEHFYYLLSVCFGVYGLFQVYDAIQLIRTGECEPMVLGGEL